MQRVIEILIKHKQQINRQKRYRENNEIISELLQMNGHELKSVVQVMQTMFFFFQSCLSNFIIIDKISPTHGAADAGTDDNISIDFVNIFFYYFKMIIQILFDHDKRLKDFNLKNLISPPSDQPPPKQRMDKNLRFSFLNKEQMESFLTDSVRMKLDYYITLEELIVP